MVKKSGEYIDDIIRYFENQAKTVESRYQFEEQKQNNNRMFALSLFNIGVFLALTIWTLSTSSYFSNVNLIQNRIFEINKIKMPGTFAGVFI